MSSLTPSPIDRKIAAVVIGTSAGGVEALGALLPILPPGFPAAVLVVIHLPTDRPSLIADLFNSRCPLPVYEAIDKQPIETGAIYFAPPDYHLLVDTGAQLALSADERVNYSRPAIDVLFESAADLYRETLLGIVLTGGSADGAAGLKAVQRAGGITVVQHPDTAEVKSMPEAALEQITPDFTLSLEQIAALLLQLSAGESS